MHKWTAIILGALITIGSVFGYVMFMKKYEQDVTTMKTIRPTEMIKANTVVTEDMIQEVSIPVMQHMKNAIVDPKIIIGKRTVMPIGETEEFVTWKLTEDDVYPGSGEQFYGFQITNVDAVNNMVRRGDKVSVWVNYKNPKLIDPFGKVISPTDPRAAELANNPNITKIFSELVLEDVKVANVKDGEGKEIRDSNISTLSKLKNLTPQERDEYNFELFRASPSGQPAFITFIMNEQQYTKFVKASTEGTVKLGMKNPFIEIETDSSRGSVVGPNSEIQIQTKK
ncbi:hypothetical protein ACFPOG_12645 [Paenibacillus aestuarii]|uniref:SAF domain-containing protein n=1 Tax=Paenibacillus aestuarii TaxID=516965 RepID=A0ABW0K715_9BACL